MRTKTGARGHQPRGFQTEEADHAIGIQRPIFSGQVAGLSAQLNEYRPRPGWFKYLRLFRGKKKYRTRTSGTWTKGTLYRLAPPTPSQGKGRGTWKITYSYGGWELSTLDLDRAMWEFSPWLSWEFLQMGFEHRFRFLSNTLQVGREGNYSICTECTFVLWSSVIGLLQCFWMR